MAWQLLLGVPIISASSVSESGRRAARNASTISSTRSTAVTATLVVIDCPRAGCRL